MHFVEMRANMNLHGSITELQNALVQMYHNIQQRFVENRLISELWSAMAHDVTQQINSLNALPSSFWNRLKNEMNGPADALGSSSQIQVSEKSSDHSLRSGIELFLQFEEPIILKAYVPIIRGLRENQGNQSLDFYILVKAHLARITRAIQAFAGDPLIIQRSNLLLQRFEKEVQEPHQAVPATTVATAKTAHPSAASRAKHETKPSRRVAKHSVSRPLSKRSLKRPNRAKPLVDKVEMHSRRARR
jgi:hypothetical protein